MKKGNAFLFVLVQSLLSVGCSATGDSGQPSDPPSLALPPGSAPSAGAGAVVVYSENNSALNAVGADGQQRTAIARDATFRGATEDGWVVFVREQELFSVRIADGIVRTLDNTPGIKHFRGVFDTNYVVYEMQNSADGTFSLHVVRANGSDRLVPVAPQPRPLEFIAVTPSRRILYRVCDPVIEDGQARCIDERLLSARLDGSDERLVLPGAPLIRHITADGRLIYDGSTDTGTVVRTVNSDGTDDRALGEVDTFFAGALPNGRIVYNRRLYGQLDLYSVAVDGTSPRALATSSEDEFFAGSTPGGRVLFLRGDPQQRRLYSVEESTGNIQALQVAGDSHVRAVAPDGRVIVSSRFGAGAEAEDNLYSVRADGTGLRALADSSDMEWFEALAPDGRVIYMRCIPAPAGPCGDPAAQSDLYSVSQNGTGTVALAASGAFEVAQAVTQDNRVVYRLIQSGDQSDLYSVPTTGGRALPLADSADDERFLTLVEQGTRGEQPGTSPAVH